MRIISHAAIVECHTKHADSKEALEEWYAAAKKATWEKPQDIKDVYRDASFLADNRVVFNIKGNDYRLVVHIRYEAGIILIKWVGPHREYDKINAETVGRPE